MIAGERKLTPDFCLLCATSRLIYPFSLRRKVRGSEVLRMMRRWELIPLRVGMQKVEEFCFHLNHENK